MTREYTTDAINGTSVMQKMRNLIAWSVNNFISMGREVDQNTADIGVMKPKVDSYASSIVTLRADVDTNTGTIATNTAQITQNSQAIQQLETDVDGCLTGLAINTDASTVNFSFTKADGSLVSLAFPVASSTQSGVMNSATFIGYIDLGNRVSALENRQSVYPVQFASDTPDQTDILTVYTTTYPDAPNPPLNGTIVTDYARNKQFTYDATLEEWIDTSQTQVPIATSTTPGVVKSSDVDGQVFVEIDGTQSMNGYDTLVSEITNLQSNSIQNLLSVDNGTSGLTIIGKNGSLATKSSVAIKNYSQATADTDNCVQTKGQIDANQNAKIDKNQGASNAGLTFKVGDDGNVKLVPFPESKKITSIDDVEEITITINIDMDTPESYVSAYTLTKDYSIAVMSGSLMLAYKFSVRGVSAKTSNKAKVNSVSSLSGLPQMPDGKYTIETSNYKDRNNTWTIEVISGVITILSYPDYIITNSSSISTSLTQTLMSIIPI